MILAPSSSGLGYLVLIQKIVGSNPTGVTNRAEGPKVGMQPNGIISTSYPIKKTFNILT